MPKKSPKPVNADHTLSANELARIEQALFGGIESVTSQEPDFMDGDGVRYPAAGGENISQGQLDNVRAEQHRQQAALELCARRIRRCEEAVLEVKHLVEAIGGRFGVRAAKF